eukprot:403363437
MNKTAGVVSADKQMTSEVQVTFKTNLPEEYQVPEVFISIATGSTNKELTQILKQLMSEDNVDIKGKKFNFMINSVFITTTVQDLFDKLGLQNEEGVEIYYQFALDKPKPTHSIPQDEWISTIRSLSHIMNEKAKTYIVGFFNGDVKVFSKNDHQELLNIKQLHQDSMIQDALFLKNDLLDKKIVVTCSNLPQSELRIGEITQVNGKFGYSQIAQSRESDYGNINDGFKCLSSNPMNNEYICSAYTSSEQAPEKAILIWRMNKHTLEGDSSQNQIKSQGGMKRVKTNIAYIGSHSQIVCNGGVQCMKWATPEKIYVGSNDHSVKIINVEKQAIEEVMFTNYKVPTCIDSAQDSLVLTGHEDASIKLWDVRTGASEKKYKASFEGHSSWISQVKFNNNVENLFISGSYDGTVKMWDIRNEEMPLATLKRKGDAKVDDYKVFGVEWNGASQILSGGSDSNISVHTIA